jgi:hypothetical protein
VIKKETEKMLKYKAVQRIWKVKTKVIPEIRMATGTISKNSENIRTTYVESTTSELHETAIVGTAHILRKILMQKYKMFITVQNISCTVPYYTM